MNPPLPTRKGKTSKRKDIDGNPMNYTIIDEDIFESPLNKRKAFCLHHIRFDDGRETFRIGYYMIAQRPRMKGKWAWGQYAPMMNKQEMQLIFERAIKKGWIKNKS
jgi:hypothetical protein